MQIKTEAKSSSIDIEGKNHNISDSERIWNRLSTKISVYHAIALSILLHGCETWTMYWRYIKTPHQFHLRCLRQIAHVKWEDKTSNTEVLEICHIQAFVTCFQLHWSGHVVWMDNRWLPKADFCGQQRSCKSKQKLKAHPSISKGKPQHFSHQWSDTVGWSAGRASIL